MSDIDRLANSGKIIADDADMPGAVAAKMQPRTGSGRRATAVQKRAVHVRQMEGGFRFRTGGQFAARQFQVLDIIADQGRTFLGSHCV